jgi:hypothetical protein
MEIDLGVAVHWTKGMLESENCRLAPCLQSANNDTAVFAAAAAAVPPVNQTGGCHH